LITIRKDFQKEIVKSAEGIWNQITHGLNRLKGHPHGR
jgi:hypothetical protein